MKVRQDKLWRLVVLVLLLVGLILLFAGCAGSNVKSDPVSQADYHATLQRVHDNLVGRVRLAMVEALAADTRHSQDWRDAHLRLLDDTAVLCSDVLAASGTPPQAAPAAVGGAR